MTRDQEGMERTKLVLNRDTDPFWVNNILAAQPGAAGPVIRSQSRLLEAQTYFRAYLADQQKKRGGAFEAWLRQLEDKVTGGLKLTVYEVKRDADVGVIFEVMNNRGKPLSMMEKVKNHLLYLAAKLQLESADQVAAEINAAWHEILERLMAAGVASSAREDQMLRGHWLMAYQPKSKEWSGADSIRERFHLKKFQGRHDGHDGETRWGRL